MCSFFVKSFCRSFFLFYSYFLCTASILHLILPSPLIYFISHSVFQFSPFPRGLLKFSVICLSDFLAFLSYFLHNNIPFFSPPYFTLLSPYFITLEPVLFLIINFISRSFISSFLFALFSNISPPPQLSAQLFATFFRKSLTACFSLSTEMWRNDVGVT